MVRCGLFFPLGRINPSHWYQRESFKQLEFRGFPVGKEEPIWPEIDGLLLSLDLWDPAYIPVLACVLTFAGFRCALYLLVHTGTGQNPWCRMNTKMADCCAEMVLTHPHMTPVHWTICRTDTSWKLLGLCHQRRADHRGSPNAGWCSCPTGGWSSHWHCADGPFVVMHPSKWSNRYWLIPTLRVPITISTVESNSISPLPPALILIWQWRMIPITLS
jgi:hypothetical protein